MKIVFSDLFFVLVFGVVYSAPQYPEINDQFEVNRTESQPKLEVHTEVEKLNEIEKHVDTDKRIIEDTITIEDTFAILNNENNNTEITRVESQPSVIAKLYKTLTDPILKLIRTPKVNVVMTNIGTCIVNGAMELISYYFPAPLIPLIASAAGLVIPFEPVVMLRERMPVTSYRRAFKTAVKGFMGTFDRYKYEDEDPYMTRRFNRRFMGNSKEDEGKKVVETDDN